VQVTTSLSLISIIIIFFVIQPAIQILSQGEDNTDSYEDLYTKPYDQKYLTKMTIQNYYLKEIIKNRKITNQLFEDKEGETANTIPFQLKSGKKIGFVMPTFTMAAYDNYKNDSFYTFYKRYAGISENEFVTTDLDLLTANVPNMTEAF
jgi:hypothetical protein